MEVGALLLQLHDKEEYEYELLYEFCLCIEMNKIEIKNLSLVMSFSFCTMILAM